MDGTEALAGGRADIPTNRSAILSSWKEIAAYLGKGIRTVQRWERELGLPVRRPVEHDQRIVIAVPAELDEWVQRQRPRRGSQSDRVALPSNGELTKFVENVRQAYSGAKRLLNTARNLPIAEETERIRSENQQLRDRVRQTLQRSEQLRSNGRRNSSAPDHRF